MSIHHLEDQPWYQKVSELGLVYPDNLNESDLVRIVSSYMISEAIGEAATCVIKALNDIRNSLLY